MRNYMLIDDRLKQIAPLIRPEGTTRSTIAAATGLTVKFTMHRIMAAAIERGVCFETFARVATDKKTPEKVYFPTAEDRDRFRVAYDLDLTERRKERQRQKARESYERHRARYSAERISKRAATRAEREAKVANGDAAAIAMRAAEREIAAQRKRLQREAKAAEKQRQQAETKKLKTRLKAETKAAGALVFKGGTDVARSKKPTFASLPAQNPNGVKPQVMPSLLRDRFAADDAAPVVSSQECRPWAAAVAA